MTMIMAPDLALEFRMQMHGANTVSEYTEIIDKYYKLGCDMNRPVYTMYCDYSTIALNLIESMEFCQNALHALVSHATFQPFHLTGCRKGGLNNLYSVLRRAAASERTKQYILDKLTISDFFKTPDPRHSNLLEVFLGQHFPLAATKMIYNRLSNETRHFDWLQIREEICNCKPYVHYCGDPEVYEFWNAVVAWGEGIDRKWKSLEAHLMNHCQLLPVLVPLILSFVSSSASPAAVEMSCARALRSAIESCAIYAVPYARYHLRGTVQIRVEHDILKEWAVKASMNKDETLLEITFLNPLDVDVE